MNLPNFPKLDPAIQLQSGFLSDSDISTAIAKGQLLTDAQTDCAKYATYELRIGDDIQQMELDPPIEGEGNLYRVKQIPESGEFSIHPGETFKIYAAETLKLPADVFAFAIPVGNMYKLGLNPEVTFADPGFCRPFFVTLCNYSPRIVKLKVGDPLARLFFFKLQDRPLRIHDGFPRQVPPTVERIRRPTDEELGSSDEAALIANVLKLVDPPHYQHAYVTNRLFSHHRNAVDIRVASLRARIASITIVVLLGLLGVLIFCGIGIYSLAIKAWPTLTEGATASLIAAAIWAALAFGLPSIRKTLLAAISDLQGSRHDG